MFDNINIHEIIRFITLAIVPFFFAITVHEVMHGYAAYKLGDNTAKDMGRLTLNPIAHIDPLGLLFLLVTRTFGWAKPVPVNFYNLKHKHGMAIVAAAGPLSNLVLAILSVLSLKGLEFLINNADISKSVYEPLGTMIVYSIQINVVLFIFNLIPILPLDGGRVLCSFLPKEMAIKYSETEKFGFIIILLLFITGAFRYIITPSVEFVYSLIM